MKTRERANLGGSRGLVAQRRSTWFFGGLLSLVGAGCSSTSSGGSSLPVADLGGPSADGAPGSRESSSFEAAANPVEASADESATGEGSTLVDSQGASIGTDTWGQAGDADLGVPDAMVHANTEGGARDASTGTTGCAGRPFCEDFERGSLDPTIWSSQASGGQSVGTVQAGLAAHGKYAVQFHANPNVVSYDFIIAKNAPAALHGHHFGRAYFYVTPKPPAAHTGYLFAGTAGFPKLKYLEVAGIGTGWQLTFVDLATGSGEAYASGGSTPLARWFCLEWEFNDIPDQATVFVDGQQSLAFSNIAHNGQSSGLVGGFADFGFGYYAWHPASYAFDVYYDDIVLDTQRVGCLP